jgi:hypothetical protein
VVEIISYIAIINGIMVILEIVGINLLIQKDFGSWRVIS